MSMPPMIANRAAMAKPEKNAHLKGRDTNIVRTSSMASSVSEVAMLLPQATHSPSMQVSVTARFIVAPPLKGTLRLSKRVQSADWKWCE
jgi:hypothetical protein